MSDTIYSYYNVAVPVDVAVETLLDEIRGAKDFNQVRRYLDKINQVKLTPKLDTPTLNSQFRTAKICMRIDRPSKDFAGTEYTYTVSFAFCNFIDGFDRKRARSIANSRMNSGKKNTTIEIKSKDRKTVREISQNAIAIISNTPSLVKAPRWFKNTPKDNVEVIFRRQNRAKKVA